MNDQPQLDPAVLGRILVLQSTVQAAPDERRLMEMVASGLAGLPGVDDSVLCIEGATARVPCAGNTPLFQLCSDAPEFPPGSFASCSERCPFTEGKSWRRIELRTPRREYGSLFLKVSGPEAFSPYLPFVGNTANLLALHIENDRTAAELSRVNRDLDQQVMQRTRQLRESEARLRNAQRVGLIGTFETDVDSKDIWWSDEVYHLLGLDPTHFTPNEDAFLELLHPEDRSEYSAAIRRSIETGYGLKANYRAKHADGQWRHFETIASVATGTGGAVLGLRGTVQDITDRRRAEEELMAEKLLSDQYINSLPGLFYVFDERRFVRWNRAWERVTGYNSQELSEMYCHDFFQGDDRKLVEQVVREVFDEGTGEAEVELATKDGRLIPYYFTGLRKVFGGKKHLVGLAIDVTDRRHAQEEREELITALETQNAELERFAYTVSHDLKSPLITIKGYVGMLREDLAEGNSITLEDDLARISEAADKMDVFLKDLLELSRIGRLVNPAENVSLDKLARDALETVDGQARERDVKVSILPGLPVVFGDRLRLGEVMQNLIDNAIKYMGDQPNPIIEIGCRRENGEPVCYVKDNGIGIDPPYHERVFGLFDQLNQQVEGSGVGLALVRRIVELHGGRIWVESEGAGQGSTFCFTLPGCRQNTEKPVEACRTG